LYTSNISDPLYAGGIAAAQNIGANVENCRQSTGRGYLFGERPIAKSVLVGATKGSEYLRSLQEMLCSTVDSASNSTTAHEGSCVYYVSIISLGSKAVWIHDRPSDLSNFYLDSALRRCAYVLLAIDTDGEQLDDAFLAQVFDFFSVKTEFQQDLSSMLAKSRS
jgi:hypothetical protein